MSMDKQSDMFGLNRFNRDESWNRLQLCLQSVITMGKSGRISCQTWFDAYREVYNQTMALDDYKGEKFYQTTKKYFINYVAVIRAKLEKFDGIEFCENYSAEWKIYYEGAKYVNMLYQVFNRNNSRNGRFIMDFNQATTKDRNFLEINMLLHNIWYSEIFIPFIERIQNLFLLHFKSNFDNQPNKKVLGYLRNIATSIAACNEGRDDKLEEYIVKLIYQYATDKYTSILDKLDKVEDFLQFITSLNISVDRMSYLVKYVFLNDSEYILLVNESITLRAVSQKLSLYRENFNNCLNNSDNREHIKTFYAMSKKFKLLKCELLSCLNKFIVNDFNSSLCTLVKDIKKFVSEFISKCNLYYDFIKKSFNDDQEYISSLNNAITEFVDKTDDSSNLSKSLSTFFIETLHRPTKPFSYDFNQDPVQSILKVFSFFTCKKSFEKNLICCISKHIIQSKSIDIYKDEFLRRLSDKFSPEFLSRLGQLLANFGDVLNENEEYKKYLANLGIKPGVKLTVNVLRSHLWPYSPDNNTIYSEPLKSELENFSAFYTKNHARMKYHIVHGESHGDVDYNYGSFKYKLTINGYQLSIFSLFNNHSFISLNEMSKKTTLCEELIIHNMEPFVTAKILIFNNNTYKINEDFMNPKKLLNLTKLSPIVKEKIVSSTSSANYSLSQFDERYAIKCLIVRIIKAEKKISYKNLIAKMTEQNKYKFNLTDKIIKEQLNELCAKEYIENAVDDTNVYLYLN